MISVPPGAVPGALPGYSGGENQCCLADTEKLPIPPYLTFTCDPRFGVHIYAVQGFTGGAYVCNIHIGESSIGRSFCDFIRSLPQSKFVYPKEKTLELLDELIRGLEKEEKRVPAGRNHRKPCDRKGSIDECKSDVV